MAQQSLKGGRKLRRCAKKKGYYDMQYHRTTARKNFRAAKRKKRKEFWKELGVKKNGQPVK